MQKHNAVWRTKVGQFNKQPNINEFDIDDIKDRPHLINGFTTFTAYGYPDYGISIKVKDGKVVFAYMGPLVLGFLSHGYGCTVAHHHRRFYGEWHLGDVKDGCPYVSGQTRTS